MTWPGSANGAFAVSGQRRLRRQSPRRIRWQHPPALGAGVARTSARSSPGRRPHRRRRHRRKQGTSPRWVDGEGLPGAAVRRSVHLDSPSSGAAAPPRGWSCPRHPTCGVPIWALRGTIFRLRAWQRRPRQQTRPSDQAAELSFRHCALAHFPGQTPDELRTVPSGTGKIPSPQREAVLDGRFEWHVGGAGAQSIVPRVRGPPARLLTLWVATAGPKRGGRGRPPAGDQIARSAAA